MVASALCRAHRFFGRVLLVLCACLLLIPAVNAVLTIACSPIVTLSEQSVCAVYIRYPVNGTRTTGALVRYNVTNSTGATVVNGSAQEVGDGTYRINFSVSVAGTYLASAQLNGTDDSASGVSEFRMGFGNPFIVATGTLYFPESKIIVDAMFFDAGNQPIAGGACNLSLSNQNQTVVVENATLREIPIAGIPHYVYNATNSSVFAANLSQGVFSGHVRCMDPGAGNLVSYSKVNFEVRFFNSSGSSSATDLTPVLVSINQTRDLLQTLLVRANEFSQEEVFLITDAFNAVADLSAQVSTGKVSQTEASAKIVDINKDLEDSLSQRSHMVKTPALQPAPTFVPSFSMSTPAAGSAVVSVVSFSYDSADILNGALAFLIISGLIYLGVSAVREPPRFV